MKTQEDEFQSNQAILNEFYKTRSNKVNEGGFICFNQMRK